MARRVAGPLRLLALLLAAYLCAPFIASLPQIGQADWANVDWAQTWSAVGISAGSATLAALVTLLGGVPLGYWLARSGSRLAAPLGFIVQLPLALPPLTSGVLLLFLLGPYSPIGRLTVRGADSSTRSRASACSTNRAISSLSCASRCRIRP